jgi:hypothetical protein
VGKSHVLARLTSRARDIAFPVVVRDYSRPGAIYRTLFRRLLWELLHTPSSFKESLLRELVGGMAKCIRRDPAFREEFDHLLDPKRRSPSWRQDFLDASIRGLEPVSARVLGPAFPVPLYSATAARVLCSFQVMNLKKRVRRWLLGEDLVEEDLEALGVARSLDDEETAREALATLSLASTLTRPLLLCLDQTEQLESSPEETGIEAMARVITALRELPGFSLVFSCLKDRWNMGYARELPSSYRDRISGGGNDLVELLSPTPEQGVRLVRGRLGGKLGPFKKKNLHEFLDRHRPSPRILLQECSRQYRSWLRQGKKGEVLLPLGGKGSEALIVGQVAMQVDPATEFSQVLVKTQAPEEIDPAVLEGAMATALTDLHLRARGKALTQVTPAKPSKLSLVVSAGGQRIGFVFDDLVHGTGFTNRLKSVLSDLAAKRVDHLVYWRRIPPQKSWKVGNQKWQELQALPNALVRCPGPEVLRRLQAFRTLCSRLQSEGRCHQEVGRAVVFGALREQTEFQEILQLAGVQRVAGGPPTAPSRDLQASSGNGGVRDLLVRILAEARLLSRERLLEKIRDEVPEGLEEAVFERAVEDVEVAGGLWRLPARGPGYVVCLR